MLRSIFLCSGFILLFQLSVAQDFTLYVAPDGNDNAAGTSSGNAKQSVAGALEHIRANKASSTETSSIVLLPGDHYLTEAITITPEFGPILISALTPGSATIKGSRTINGKWRKHEGDILRLQTDLDISAYSQLFIDGKKQLLARYPNYDSTASHYDGYAADAIDPLRVANWKHPEGAIIHAMHSGEWGGFHYEIESADKDGTTVLRGGHQNNRPSAMHKDYRMVENVFEELDSPGEWYFDAGTSTLYLYPPQGVNLANAKIEVSMLDHLMEIKGNPSRKVTDISIEGIRFEHCNRTFMKEYEPLLRSDWMIYRGGAIYIENAQNCLISDCELTNLGGNAIFVSGYARDISIQNNHIYHCGASGVSFVGLSSAVRSPSFTYREFVDFEDLDKEVGPKSDEYPASCSVDNNLIHDIGEVEKQVAGVQISMAMNISVSHNSIYDVPRAGINVSEGTWGGHIIEFNDVFNTVLESSDHGSFNSWGRDRFWHPNRKTMDDIMEQNPDMPYLDAVHTTIIRNNRMRCDHGWDIDLDDGSSNYHLYNNLCLNGGIKLREGFYRVVENNIMVNNGFHPHVWFRNSGDVFKRNIVMTDHKDIRLQGWGTEVDYNLFPDSQALTKARQNGTDAHSTFGDPMFIDPTESNFNVSTRSPAFDIGFVNFTMDQFGVQDPKLKKLAKSPVIPPLVFASDKSKRAKTAEWLGTDLKNIETMGERSAAGLDETGGVLITAVRKNSLADRGGLQTGDVLLECEGKKTDDISELFSAVQGNNWKGNLKMVVLRNQEQLTLSIKTK